MKTSEIEAAINALCLSGQYGTLYRILKPIEGTYQILSSDKSAEAKRRALLKILKRTKG